MAIVWDGKKYQWSGEATIPKIYGHHSISNKIVAFITNLPKEAEEMIDPKSF